MSRQAQPGSRPATSPRPTPRILGLLVRLFKKRRLFRLTVVILSMWIIGATALWIVEGGRDTGGEPNPFEHLSDAFWNIAVYLLSGLDTASPSTGLGKAIVGVMLVVGVGIVAVFTGTIASILVEQRMGRRMLMPGFELTNHIVICNWNSKGLPILKELHAAIVESKRVVVIVCEYLDDVDLPEKEDMPELEDVYLIKGDPTNEITLKRANVHDAHAVIVLADPHQQHLADARSILICMAVQSVCTRESRDRRKIMVEGIEPANNTHLVRAGATEIVSAGDFALKLLAQSALHPGLSTVYENLLKISADTNEVYMEEAPPEMVGKTYTEAAQLLEQTRDSANPVLLLGLRRKGQVMMNPPAGRCGPLQEGDQLILIAWEPPRLAKLLADHG